MQSRATSEVRWIGLKQYPANMALLWIFIFVVRTNGFYLSFLRPETQAVLLAAALGYTICLAVLTTPKELPESKAYVAMAAAAAFLRQAGSHIRILPTAPGAPAPRITAQGKSAILFMLVKAFYLPVMLNSMFSNYFDARSYLMAGPGAGASTTSTTFFSRSGSPHFC